MKLELELQALSKVYQDMRRNEYTMTYLQNILNANHFPDEVWKGRGKDAYLSLEKNLQKHTDDLQYKTLRTRPPFCGMPCSPTRRTAEQTVGTDTLQLNADQIF